MTAPTEDEVRAWLESERRIAERGAAVAREVSMSDRAYERLRVLASSALAMLDEARKDRERLDWYEQQHKLHGAVEVLYVYVVDEYELTITHDGNPVRYVRAPTLRAAIDQARGA